MYNTFIFAIFFQLYLSFFVFVTDRLYSLTEKQRYDGWFNNLAHPDWGSVSKYPHIY